MGDRIDDKLTQFFYWLHPPLKKERDLLLDKLDDYRQKLANAEVLVTRFALEDQRHRVEIEALKRPEAPKPVRPGSAAEVRRIMELESFKQEEN